MSHIPVLLNEILEALTPEDRPLPARIIDGTLGAGGHSAALLERGVGAVLGFDRDPVALALAREKLAPWGERAQIVHASYVDMQAKAQRIGWQTADGILLDLGVSSMQFDQAERGFAFMQDGPLDMRFDQSTSGLTAGELVNGAEERELADIFYQFGEERESRRLARVIVRNRPYETTSQLSAVIEQAVPRPPRHKKPGIHPATRIFQALRIAVNDELGTIAQVLPVALDLLESGGRLAVISFHSLEDRIVKQVFKQESTDCICPPKTPICICGHKASITLLNRKPIVASEIEIAHNPRSRSAKLRVVEKK